MSTIYAKAIGESARAWNCGREPLEWCRPSFLAIALADLP